MVKPGVLLPNMNSLTKLESSVQKLLEDCEVLRGERDKAVHDAETTHGDLERALTVIDSLQSGDNNEWERDFQEKKKTLINHIRTLIARVDRLKIDDITDV